MSDDERRKLVSTEQSLGMDEAEPKIPTAISGLETFTLGDGDDDKSDAEEAVPDADSFFNLPGDGEESDSDSDGEKEDADNSDEDADKS